MSDKRISKTGVGFLIDASAKTYETLEKQLREFISNSLDAGATRVDIEVLPRQKRIVITDNGEGMTEEEFDNNYLVIGCSNKYGDRNTIGRIGVGKFSSIPLSETLTIRTKKKDMRNVYQASLDLFLLKDPGNRTKDVTGLILGKGEYVDPTVSDPNEEFSTDGCFTKITMNGVPDEIISRFERKDDFENILRDLGMILPLEYSESSEAMKKLRKQDIELYKELMDCSKDKKLEVRIRTPQIPGGRILYRSLFGDDFAATGEQIAGDLYIIKSPKDDSPAPISIIGYFADMTSGSAAYSKWKGLNVRIQNTTVVNNYFFDHDDAQADLRITGEIHIVNANEEELITMNRAGFVTKCDDYIAISSWLTDKLNEFARRYVRKRTDFNSKMKKKQAQLQNQLSVSESIERCVAEGFYDVALDMSKLELNELKKEDEIDQMQALKDEFNDQIIEIIKVPDTTQDQIVSTIIGDKFSITVPEKYFDYEADIQGERYRIKYVNHDKEEPVIDVDTVNKVIRVNRNSATVNRGTHSMVMSLILLEMAFIAYGNDMEKLKEKIRELLKLAFSD
jgi:hypothetical protein